MRAHATPWVEAGSLLEIDDKSNPQKFNGMGEPGICGSGAAVANAVYNARAAGPQLPILHKVTLDP